MDGIHVWNYMYDGIPIQVKDIFIEETSFTNGCHKQELYVNGERQDIVFVDGNGTRMTGVLPGGEQIKVTTGVEDNFHRNCYLFVNHKGLTERPSSN